MGYTANQLEEQIDRYSDEFLEGKFKHDLKDRLWEGNISHIKSYILANTDKNILLGITNEGLDIGDFLADNNVYISEGETVEEVLGMSFTIAHVSDEEVKSDTIDGWEFYIFTDIREKRIMFIEVGDYKEVMENMFKRYKY